jgi:DtxR family Mn-dependent transcriptional regulator
VPSLTVENYLKAIYLISSRRVEADAVATGELAQALAVSPGTVTGMLKTLSEADLATYTPYEGARLTSSGRRLALKVLRRHRLLELFLAKTLRMTWDEVHEEAEHMEHAASDRLIDRIDNFLGNPAVDPHGDPIPRPDGSLTEPSGTPLAQLERGAGSGWSGWSSRTPRSSAT